MNKKNPPGNGARAAGSASATGASSTRMSNPSLARSSDSPQRACMQSPPKVARVSPPPLSRSSSRSSSSATSMRFNGNGSQLRSALSGKLGSVQADIAAEDASFIAERPAKSSRSNLVRSGSVRESRKHPYGEQLILLNEAVESLGTNLIKHHTSSSISESVTLEKARRYMLRPSGDEDSQKANGRGQSQSNPSRMRSDSFSSVSDDGDAHAAISYQAVESFRFVSENEGDFDVFPSSTHSAGGAGITKTVRRHSRVSVRSKSFVDDLMMVSGEADALSLRTPQERAKISIPSTSVVKDLQEDVDNSGGEEQHAYGDTLLEVTDTSVDGNSDSTVEIPESRAEFEGPSDGAIRAFGLHLPLRSNLGLHESPMFNPDAEFQSHSSTTASKSRAYREKIRASLQESSEDEDEVAGPEWDTETEKPLPRRQQSVKSKQEPGVQAAAHPQPERSPTRKPLNFQLPPSQIDVIHGSSDGREAHITSRQSGEIGQSGRLNTSSLEKTAFHHKRSQSASEAGHKDSNGSGSVSSKEKPQSVRRINSTMDFSVKESDAGSRQDQSSAIPKPFPDAAARLRNVTAQNSMSVSGVAAAHYMGGYLPVEGMLTDSNMSALNTFLKEGRLELERGISHGRSLTAVMGSDCAEADAILCSIAYAYLLHSTIKSDHHCFLPVINMRREDLSLRMEALWIFEICGIDEKWLVFIDEINLSYYTTYGNLRLVLVDHSKLAPHQEGLQEAVVEIVDHVPAGQELKNQDLYPWVLAKEIQQVGSCATLIAERFAWEAPQLLAGQGIQRLLLAPILLDTANLDRKAGQSTQRDEMMVTLLLKGAGCYGRHGFYKLLRKKKFDTSVLTTRDMLRKDFNLWKFGPVRSYGYRGEILVGMSSIGLTLGEFLSRQLRVIDDIIRFREWKRLKLLIIITGYYDRTGVFRRELVLAPEHAQMAEDLAHFFNVSCEEGLELQPLSVKGLPKEMKAYSQGNATMSRKRIQPMLSQFFSR